jgi:hypothetical protein
MREQLKTLYEQNEKRIADVLDRCPEGMEGPFYIYPVDAYLSSELKVAFIGQETNGWTSDALDDQLQTYREFNLGEKYYSSPFWNVIRKLESALTGSTLNSCWLNLNRFDEKTNRPSDAALQFLGNIDDILVDELRCVKPDISIWFTGPTYDNRLSNLLGCQQSIIDGFDLRKLCRLESDQLVGLNIRTYHPNYLRRSGLETSVIEAISKLTAKNA